MAGFFPTRIQELTWTTIVSKPWNRKLARWLPSTSGDLGDMSELVTTASTQKASEREDAPKIRAAVIEQARSRGFSQSESETFADNFFKTWDSQGYKVAFDRFLNRLV
jgi:hypothetical protein